MSQREAAVLTFKLLALYLMFLSASTGASFLMSIAFDPHLYENELEYSYLASAVLSLGVGVLIWMKADALALRLTNISAQNSSDRSMTPPQILQLACTIIGLWLIVTAISSLANWGTVYLLSLQGHAPGWPSSVENNRTFDMTAKAEIISSIARLLIGILLLAKSPRISAYLWNVRTSPSAVSSNDSLAENGHVEETSSVENQ